MKVPDAVTFVADRLEIELCCPDGGKPTVTRDIRPHSDPSKGWIVDISISGKQTGMLAIQATMQRLGYGSVAWDLERNAVVITGKAGDTPVGVFITRTAESYARRFSSN